MKLYEITNDMKELQAMADSGELSQQDIHDTLASLECQFERKVEACLMVRQDMMKEVAGIDAEIERLNKLRKAPANNIDKLNTYIKNQMLDLERDKVKTGLFDVTLRKATVKLGEIDECKIPEKYWIEVPATKKLDRKALLSDAKLADIEGVSLAESDRALMVK